MAIEKKSLKLVKFFVEHGAEINTTVFHQINLYLIRARYSIITFPKRRQTTILNLAKLKSEEIFQYLQDALKNK